MHWHNKRKQNQASSHLPGSHCPNTKCPNGSATPNSAYGHTGVRNANPKPATGTVVACTKGRCCLQVALEHYGTSFGIQLQGCNQRMEKPKMESGEAGSPFQENRCSIFLLLWATITTTWTWDSKYQSWNSVNMGPKKHYWANGRKRPAKQTALRCQHPPPMLGHGMKLHKEPTKKAHTGISCRCPLVVTKRRQGENGGKATTPRAIRTESCPERTCLGGMDWSKEPSVPPELLRQFLRPHSGHDKQISSRPGLFRRKVLPSGPSTIRG